MRPDSHPARSCRCGASLLLLLRRIREVNLHTLTGIRAGLHTTARAEMTVPEVVDRPSRPAGRADLARHRPPVTGCPGARVPLGSFFRPTGRAGCIVWPAPEFVRGPDALRRARTVASGMATMSPRETVAMKQTDMCRTARRWRPARSRPRA